LPAAAAQGILADIAVRYDTSALIRDAVLSSLHAQEYPFMRRLMNSKSWASSSPARQILLEMICGAVLNNSDPDETTALLKMISDGNEIAGWQGNAIATAFKVHAGSGIARPIQLTSAPRINSTDSTLIQAVHVLFQWPGRKERVAVAEASALSARDQQVFAEGRQRYLTTCSGCHGTDGTGLARFGPSLVGSEWVLGDERRLALILLHGMEGPVEVNGKMLDVPAILPVMPAPSVLGDREITAIMTYIRNEWGNHAGPVAARTVGTVRHTTQGRVVPWTADDLNRHMRELEEAP
jgi:mono/diheme cytochrome c family protein